MNIQKEFEILLPSGEVKNMKLADIFKKSDKTVLFFYPKDNTPWCTIENKDFSCLKQEFENKWVQLIGVSKDSINSHKNFISKHELTNSLLSDPDLILHKELGAYGEKMNYGKVVQWVIRSTFLINKDGTLEKEWKNIKATGHAERILKEFL